jgi:hypothetical protein
LKKELQLFTQYFHSNHLYLLTSAFKSTTTALQYYYSTTFAMKTIKEDNINNSVVESYPNLDAMLFDLLGTGTDGVTTTMINNNNSKSNSNFNINGIAKMDSSNNINNNNNSGIVESYPNLDAMLFDLLGDTADVTMINAGMTMMKEDTGKQEQDQVVKSSSSVVVTAAELDSYLTSAMTTTTTATTSNSSSSSSSNSSCSSQPLLVEFRLHPKLQKNMSNGLVQRVSFYSIIHDINKETTTAGADIVTYSSNIGSYNNSKTTTTTALIDEEQWLLDVIAIDSSSSSRNLNFEKKTNTSTTTDCSMVIYKNNDPTAATSSSHRRKTRLWKPQYSWWKAKSGYNAYLEPKYHNKRWGYLWKLIHYHKFLKKCIKKLKKNHYRNENGDGGSGGIICLNNDNNSSSSVYNFLCEEVYAVSDHLAIVSLYDSDTWMDCLDHFDGWTNESSVQVLKRTRQILRNLELTTSRGDIDFGIDIGSDSALLVRSQIDEQYLSALIRVKTAKSPSLVNSTADGVDTTAEEDNDCQSNNSKSSSSSWSSSTISSVGGVGLSDQSSRLRPAPKRRPTPSLRRREHRLQKTFKYSLPVINPSSSSSSLSFVAAEVVSRPSTPHRPRRRKAKQKYSHNAEMQSVATSSSTAPLIAGHSSQVQSVGYNNCDPHYHYSHHHQQEWHQGWWWWSESNGWQYHYSHHHPYHHYNPFYYGDNNTDDDTYHFPLSACDTATSTTTFNTGIYSRDDGTY